MLPQHPLLCTYKLHAHKYIHTQTHTHTTTYTHSLICITSGDIQD